MCLFLLCVAPWILGMTFTSLCFPINVKKKKQHVTGQDEVMTLLQLWDRMLSFHAWRTSSQGSAQVNTRPHFSRRPELWTNTGHENMLHASPNILISQGTLLPHPPKSKTKRNLHHQSSEFVASPHVKGRDSSLHSVLDESSLKRVCGTETSDGLDQKQPTVFHRDCVGENVGHETWSLLWWRQWLKQIKPGCQYFNLN